MAWRTAGLLCLKKEYSARVVRPSGAGPHDLVEAEWSDAARWPLPSLTVEEFDQRDRLCRKGGRPHGLWEGAFHADKTRVLVSLSRAHAKEWVILWHLVGKGERPKQVLQVVLNTLPDEQKEHAKARMIEWGKAYASGSMDKKALEHEKKQFYLAGRAGTKRSRAKVPTVSTRARPKAKRAPKAEPPTTAVEEEVEPDEDEPDEGEEDASCSEEEDDSVIEPQVEHPPVRPSSGSQRMPSPARDAFEEGTLALRALSFPWR